MRDSAKPGIIDNLVAADKTSLWRDAVCSRPAIRLMVRRALRLAYVERRCVHILHCPFPGSRRVVSLSQPARWSSSHKAKAVQSKRNIEASFI
jgi:hypothetical protein